MIHVPLYYTEGARAAELGTRMSSLETPLGFTFQPHRSGSVERYNFLHGCTAAYFGEHEPMKGEVV